MITAWPVPGKQKAIDLCNAFLRGAPKTAKGNVFYGIVDHNALAWERIKAKGEDWFWIDGSYFDSVRGQQFRISKNSVQGKIQPSDGKRFDNLGLRLKPLRTRHDGHYLLVPQSDLFMRLVARDPRWLEKTCMTLDRDRTTKVRPWLRDKLKLQRSLPDDLADTYCLVTHTSAAAVSAVLEGVPVIVSSMHALAGVLALPGCDTRLDALKSLADQQFTIEEISNGYAWRVLNGQAG